MRDPITFSCSLTAPPTSSQYLANDRSGDADVSALLEQVRARTQLPSRAVGRAIRKRARVSQAEMAAELGVHVTTVQRWELGLRQPRGRFAARYAELLRLLEAESSKQ